MVDFIGSREIMAMPTFDHTHPKITEITFNFPEFVLVCKQPVYSINSFLIQTILESHNQTGHVHF